MVLPFASMEYSLMSASAWTNISRCPLRTSTLSITCFPCSLIRIARCFPSANHRGMEILPTRIGLPEFVGFSGSFLTYKLISFSFVSRFGDRTR